MEKVYTYERVCEILHQQATTVWAEALMALVDNKVEKAREMLEYAPREDLVYRQGVLSGYRQLRGIIVDALKGNKNAERTTPKT